MQYVANRMKCIEEYSLEISLKVKSTMSKLLDKINSIFLY